MTKQAYEPVVKEGVLYGLSINPYGKDKPHWFGGTVNEQIYGDIKHINFIKSLSQWEQAEKDRLLVKVCEDYIERSSKTRFWTIQSGFRNQLIQTIDTFTADKNESGELINLNVL